MVSPWGRSLGVVALGLALLSAPASAQNGRIRGAVRDPQGVALAGATVRATNQASGAVRRSATMSDGGYVISDLAPGTYEVAVSLPGLRTQQQQDIRVNADAETVVDFVMQAIELEAVTVTAMLREQDVADVPFSIAAPTAQVLRQRGAEDIEDIAANIAGFSVQNLGPGQSQPAIRGASSGQIARDQPGVKEEVGSYLDEAVVSLSLFTPDLDLFDVARVEVLRGPQGTLFGSGSLSGTVRYISNQPELGVSRTFGEAGMSLIDGGDAGSTAKLGFNVPLGERSAFRIAGYSNRLGGWIDAVQANLKLNRDVNGGDRSGFRAALRLAPNDRFSITPRLVVQRVKMDGWNRIDAFNILANPYTVSRNAVQLRSRQLFAQIAEPYSDDFVLGDINLRYDFSGMSFSAITSYTHRDIEVVRDAGALYASIVGGSVGLPENVYTLDAPLYDSTLSKVWTQEVRLSGNRDRLHWVIGGFYSHNTRDYGQSVFVEQFEALSGIPTRGLRAPRDVLFFSDLGYKLDQTAVFGEATIAAAEALELTAGVRWYNFDEDRAQVFDGIFGNDNNGTSLVSQPGSAKASGVAPRFIASYKASPNLTINAQAAQGFRLGGINDPLNVPICTPEDLATYSGRDTWKDEKAWNYEIGAKSRIMGGRGSFNISAFYMDIRNLQLTVTAGSCSSRLILNVDKARSQGVEVEFTAAPSDHVDFSVAVAFNDSKLRSTFRDQLGQILPGIESGNRLPSVPEIQGNAAITFGWPVGSSRAFVTGSYQYMGSRFTLIDDLAAGYGTVNLLSFGANTIGAPLTQSTFTFNPEMPAYSIANLRVGVIRSAWEVALFVNNLTDEVAYLALDRERGKRARVGYLTNQPRTAGVSLRFNY
jgi:iron complex outermembrane receptor protein